MTPGGGRRARYLPAEDTYLLRDSLSGFQGDRCLEIGFGSGAVIASVSERFALAAGTDSIELAQARTARAPGVDIVLADRATCFRDGSFDLVFFNPPYLPSGRIEDLAVDGGPTGIEVPLAFLAEAARVLREHGTIMALLSSEGDLGGFVSRSKGMGLRVVRVAERKLFYEESLVVFRMEKESEAVKAKKAGKFGT